MRRSGSTPQQLRYADLGAAVAPGDSRLNAGVLSVTVGKTSGSERFGRRQVAVA